MRPSWDQYFLDMAIAVSSRATCSRKAVGAVLVRDNRVLATGFNGSMPGRPHCTSVGCLMCGGHCVRTTHAEINALAQAAKHGVSVENASIYCTISPCWNCFRTCVTAGVKEFYFGYFYRDAHVIDEAKAMGIRMEELGEEKKAGGRD